MTKHRHKTHRQQWVQQTILIFCRGLISGIRYHEFKKNTTKENISSNKEVDITIPYPTSGK